MDNQPKRQKLEASVPFYAVLSSELTEPTPLIEVYMDTIKDIRLMSKVIVDLNSVWPIKDLNHLKRARGKEILLCKCSEGLEAQDVCRILEEKRFDMGYLENNIKRIKVAGIAPKTKKQYEIVRKLWPCNFHSDNHIEILCNNALFSVNEIEQHVTFMQIAVDVAIFYKSKVGVAIVDPNINSLVAVGFDQQHNNPCQHAIMVAIDNVALTQNGGAWKRVTEVSLEDDRNLNGVPSDILYVLRQKYCENFKFGATQFKTKSEIEMPSDGPYLCTGYVVYVTHEPCIMCSMAVIHSRAKYVFFGKRSLKGGLISLCQIHTVKNLNHHYEVFGGLLEDECSKL